MLRVMPQNWEPANWAEEQTSRVAREITRLRGKRSAQWLSDQTNTLGYRVSRAVIADIENGRRRYVTLSELTVLAYALGTAPVALLFPPPYGEQIDLLPDHKTPKFSALQAFCGIAPQVNRLTAHENMQPLRDARLIAELEDQKRWLVIQLEEFGDSQPEFAKQVRADLDRITRLLAEKRGQDGG